MTGRFAGRTAIVTGASRGIGLGIAERLVADGARVVLTARKQEALDEAVKALGGAEHLDREGLVDLDQVDVTDRQPGVGQGAAGRPDRAETHDLWG